MRTKDKLLHITKINNKLNEVYEYDYEEMDLLYGYYNFIMTYFDGVINKDAIQIYLKKRNTI